MALVILTGFMATGKTEVGRKLAALVGAPFVDTDALVESATGRTIADIFATDGEKEFRRIEEDVIRAALQSHDGILSLGGGAVTTPSVRDALAGHTVIYLEISAAEGVRRTGGSTVRPLLAGPDRHEKFKALMAERVPLYRRVATMRVNTNRRNPGAVVRHIADRLENPQAPRRRRRRPSWRRGPSSLTPKPSTEAPPTPAAVAARHPGGSPGRRTGGPRND